MTDRMSYEKAGVSIDTADAAKREMAKALATADPRVLNRLGAFASLFEAGFPGLRRPVLVLKTEEPGSKQKLAFAHGRVESICQDMVNHLVNDIAVMGATPLSVQDCIVCGKLDKDIVTRIVAAIAAACRRQGCTLTGGETSEQPGVIEPGTYILTSSIVGVVDHDRIIDGLRIAEGDVVLAAASNGLHTNGYSLVRALMARRPEIMNETVEGASFLDALLRPHRCYYQAIKGMFDWPELHGLAHITGGGVQDNLNRILPAGLDAAIDAAAIRILPIFKLIRRFGDVSDADMLRTFNLGVGLTLVVSPASADRAAAHLAGQGVEAYPIGQIVPGNKTVVYRGGLNW